MSTGYKIHENYGAHFLTFQIVGWVDLFTLRDYRDVVIESFKFCQQNKGLNLFAYVIMSNHIPRYRTRTKPFTIRRSQPSCQVTNPKFCNY
jgi:hypothetical protein